MERQTPTVEEIVRLKDFGDVSKLAKADQFFHQVGLAPLWKVQAAMFHLDHGYPQDHRPPAMHGLSTKAGTRR